ncbi:uncharacterized protein At4g22758 isoform X2 [Dendrobium catenatum]|uniref:DUF7054 domain-containing protein n=1 Tax=Dendrobium catenatum TaxID=906689 RepID=A0A2I0WBQ2_9ASPA|nr:uncharacterized protein At4g22758 isoform X2 [Dendrobium catenatum]PKU73087.1 Uncharacterized protein MA16_Dca016154 [Dendrobium catenatum]
MTDKIPRLLRSTVYSSGDIHRPPNPTPSPHRRTRVSLQKPKRRKPRIRILSRSASEPILRTVQMFIPGNEEGKNVQVGTSMHEEPLGINENPMFPRYHTCTDVFSPFLCPGSTLDTTRDSIEEAKVVVSVAVERSPGPVNAMVRLGASVEEVIEVIVKKYCREGRSPQLDRDSTASFELHYSHFCLQSLKKSDKIGEIGGRSFYLCTNSGRRSFTFGRETNDSGNSTDQGSQIVLASQSGNQLVLSQIFFSIVSKKLKKIERRTKKFWKVVTRIICM